MGLGFGGRTGEQGAGSSPDTPETRLWANSKRDQLPTYCLHRASVFSTSVLTIGFYSIKNIF